MFFLAVSLFFTHPAPLDMPRAEAYFIKEADGRLRLEDRYQLEDLWTSRAVLGRWEDDDGRFLTLARLDVVPPKFSDATVTRMEYTGGEVALDPKNDLDLRDQAIAKLSPVEPAEEPRSPKQKPRGFKDVLYFEGTNTTALVCAFRKEGFGIGAARRGDEGENHADEPWYLATWELVEGDDIEWARELFEKEILEKWDDVAAENLRSETGARPDAGKKRASEGKSRETPEEEAAERELLRIDARNSVTNYLSWHVSEADEFSVLDDLPDSMHFVQALTNDLCTMRRRYSETMPSPVDGTNVLAVARIFATREDYLAAAGEDMSWTAAYWNPLRRELVAYLPQGGADQLMRTIRHEAFHQYLSYASSMLSASPWINEGYAQYFEDEESEDWGLEGMDGERIDLFARLLPGVIGMDYDEFYDGGDDARRIKYRLAWSIAVFLEKGAPEIRFEPFKDLKKDYIAALLKTKDMRQATVEAFASKERLELFVREWKKFWKNR